MPTTNRSHPGRVSLALCLALVAMLTGCMGFGSSADKTPPQTTAAVAPAPKPMPGAGQVLVQPDPAADAVAMLDVFRKQIGAGKTLDKTDDVYAERSAQLALEYASDGSRRPWTNPETGTTGTIVPTKTFQDKDGGYCREYDQTIQIRQRGSKDIKGQGEYKGGVACRQTSGRWKFLS